MTFFTSIALASFLAGSTADAVTTHGALARGGVEANPVLVHQGVMIGLKAGTGVLVGVGAGQWEKQHPRWTRALLVAGGGLYGAVAWHNAHIGRGR